MPLSNTREQFTLRDKRILITGGAGFLGTHLVAELLREGVPQESIIIPRSAQYDLRSHDDVERLFADYAIDVVFHLASISGGISLLREQPAMILRDNLLMHTHLLDAAHRYGVKKFVAVGSGLMYPANAKIPLQEDDIWQGYPASVTACYGVATRNLLLLSQLYRAQYGFCSIMIIPCNLYGPNDHFFSDHPHVIPSMICKLDAARHTKEPVEFFGTGEAAREFLYVTDAAALLVCAAKEYDDPTPLNIGAGTTITMKELAMLIASQLHYTDEIHWDVTKPEGDKIRCFDVSRMHASLSQEVVVGFEQGLRETIDWYLSEKERRHKI